MSLSPLVWRSVDDFTDQDIRWILDRADLHRRGAFLGKPGPGEAPVTVGLLFLEPSLRTRTGFTSAAIRLGFGPVSVVEQRQSEISMAESVSHTLRTLSGYCDVLVARTPHILDGTSLPKDLECPLISGGDRGSIAEHPTQALVDLFALRTEFGRVEGLHVVVVGDPTMRTVGSLLRALVRLGVGSIALMTTPTLLNNLALPPQVEGQVSVISDWTAAANADVVYVAGIPHGAVPLADRDHLRLTQDALSVLSDTCVITSPLPVIDEVDTLAWSDSRVKAFKHSDDGLFIRMAVLEFALTQAE